MNQVRAKQQKICRVSFNAAVVTLMICCYLLQWNPFNTRYGHQRAITSAYGEGVLGDPPYGPYEPYGPS